MSMGVEWPVPAWPWDDRRTVRRHAARVFVLLLTVAAGVQSAQGSQGGRSGFSGNPGTSAGALCSVCHGPDGAASSAVTVTGPTVVDAGTVSEYMLTIVGGSAVTAGVDISVSNGAGSLEPANSDLIVLDGELVHNGPKAFASGTASYSFLYRAPNYDADVTLYAASNSSNGKFDLAGDAIAATTLSVTVQNGFEPPPPPPPPAAGELAAEIFATGLNAPVGIANAGDDRLFVIEQEGRIRVVEPDGTVLAMPFLDISDRVDSSGSEQGLLGLAFHPQFASNGVFFVNYTHDPAPGPAPGVDRTRVSRFLVSAVDPNVAVRSTELILLEYGQPYKIHNAGDINFGPDGLLYIASGDGGPGGDALDNAQNPGRLLGKILRINVDVTPGTGATDCDISGNNAYVTPPNNAFADGQGGAGCDEIFALGLRNPWQFSFDRGTGAMWVGDVGQNTVEEITYIPPGTNGGLNLGWHCYEGSTPYDLSDCNLDYYFPAWENTRQKGDCSVTGGLVYRGEAYPVLQGQYFYSDFCRQSIRSLSGAPGVLTEREVLPAGILAAPSAFGEDANGEMYVADIATGIIYRLRAASTRGDVDGDGDVDLDDLRLIFAALGTPADGPADPRDVGGDGAITRRDLREARSLCDRPFCAVE